ncbi:hypothetical protein BC2230_40868 [Burkholderia cepacia]
MPSPPRRTARRWPARWWPGCQAERIAVTQGADQGRIMGGEVKLRTGKAREPAAEHFVRDRIRC